MKKVLFIAHRGGGEGILENRIGTIKKALKSNIIDAIEVDIRQTRDKFLVLSHNRGIDINGKKFWIDKISYAEIKHLGIPTLEEVLVLFKKSNKILNLDIKDKNSVREIIKVIKKNNYIKKIYFDSPNLETLFEIQEELPNGEYFLSSSSEDSRDFAEKRFIRIIALILSTLLSRFVIFLLKKKLRKVKLNGVSLFYRWVNKKFVNDLHEFGFKVFVWGTDNERIIRRLLKMGVDGIKTRKTEIFKKLAF